MEEKESNLQSLYETLKKEGYTPPAFDEFRSDMSDPDNLRGVYETLKKEGYTPPAFDEFRSDMSDPQSEPTTAQTPQPTQPTGKPSKQDKMQISWNFYNMLNDFRLQSQARIEQAKRASMPMTAEGRRKLKAGEFQAQLAGTPAKVMGLTPNVRTAETATTGEGKGDTDAPKPLQSAQSPVPYGVRYVNGKPVTEWLLPDGSLTTNLVEADKAEYGARTVRLRNRFALRMKQNGLDPSNQEDVRKQSQIDAETEDAKFMVRTSAEVSDVIASDVIAQLWQEAEEKHKADKNANAEREWSNYAAMGGGREMRAVTASANRHADQVSHMTRFDLEKMMETTWASVGNRVTAQCYDHLRSQYPQTTEQELQKAAADMARGMTDNAVYQYAVKQNAPKSTLEFFGRTVADANVLNSISKGLARSQAGTSGDLAAYEQAMSEYGKNHRVAQIGGTVAGMAIDPVTYISGGVGSLFGKGAMWAGGRFLASRAAGMSTQVGTRLFSSSLSGRLITGAAAGAGNFMTFETLKEAENQFLHGGHINERGENEGYSAEALLKSAGKGLILGGVTGTMTPILGNVTDNAVKATGSTVGKAALRATELGVSTVTEGTVFATPEWIENSKREDGDPNKRTIMDIWTDNMAMMLGFKLSHGIKSAPRVIASLRPIKPADGRPLTQAERNHNRMNFEERLRKSMDMSPNDLSFSSDEREELRRAGYGELADLFSGDKVQEASRPNPTDGAIGLHNERGEAEEIRNGRPEFDGYSDMERLMQDGSVSQAARAKAYYILTGRMLPMGTVTGWTKDTADDGRVTINAVTADGEVVTSRTFANEKAAEQQTDNINHQAELNSVDFGERYREALADEMLLEESISQVSPGADMEKLKRIYRAVKAGNKDMSEEQVALAGIIDEAMERNKDVADRHRPEAIRAELREEYGIEVDDALRKSPDKRTAKEKEIVQTYLERLFPEEASERAEEPTPEQQEAQGLYEEGKLLYGRFEEGDPNVTAEVDAIVIRMQEANQLFEDAFGADSEYYRFHLNENPWSLLNDPELTAEQQDTVLYYINSKAALDGVMDASHEAADRKRTEVEQSVAKRTHKDTGAITPATMKINNREVYIVKGDVAMYPDGSGVDVHKSSESIVVMDAESGEYEFTSPEQIFKVGENIDPKEEMRTALEAIEQERYAIFGNIEGENIPVGAESAMDIAKTEEMPTENGGFLTETAPKATETVETSEQSGSKGALSRIPVHEETGEPMFEAVDKDTAWEGLVEAAGSEKDAADIALAQIEQANADLESLKKKPPTMKTPKLKGSPMAMAKAKQDAQAKYDGELADYNQRLADTQEKVNAWTSILGVHRDRTSELRRQQEEERRQTDAERHDQAVARFEEEMRLKAERDAEQAAIGTHAVNPKIKEKWDSANKAEGNADAITLPDGSTIRGRYVLTEAGAASASHDVNNAYEPTEGFPIDANGQSVNDRDYLRDKDAQRIVEQIAGAYDSRAMQTPVIVSRDGVVLSGNNRTMSGDLAARQGTDKAYTDYLREFGTKYGFTAEQVDGMEHPRIVFVPDEALPYDATTFSRFNAQEMKSQSKPEAAVKLGKIVPDNVFTDIVTDLSKYDRLSDYYADESAVAHALGALMQAGVINDKQMPEMRTGTALSATGKELIENTLIGKVFQSSPDAVRQIISIPSMRETVVMGLGEIASNRTLGKRGYDLSEELSAAVDLVSRAKNASPDVYKAGIPVSPFGRMQGLFDDQYGDSRVTDAAALLLADTLNSGKPSELRKILAMYNKSASEAAAGEVDLFNESGKPYTKEDILTEVNEYFRNANPKEQRALVEAAIAERKRRAEAEAGQRGGSATSEQTPNAAERGAGEQRTGLVDRGQSDLHSTETKGIDYNYDLSDELDENGRPFVLNPKGELEFGRLEAESGLTEAPILLSEGIITNPKTNEGYGLIHIEARHGKQIRQNGYANALEFIEHVATHWESIREAKDRHGNPTFRLIAKGKHNDTVMVELSGDGTYWNINTAGIFKTSYGKNAKEVYNRHTTEKPTAESAEASQGSEQSGTTESSRMNAPTTSDRKDSGSLPKKQTGEQKSSKSFAIAPTTYTNKKGKTSDVWLVKFDRDLSKDEKSALDTFTREPLTEGKKTSRGWYDRKEGGYMMRSEEAAKQLAEMIGNEDAVADAQPMTAAELREAVAETPVDEKPKVKKTEKPKKAPLNRVNIEEVMTAEKGGTKLSDRAEPVKKEPEVKHEISDDEMNSLADELRDLLGIGEDEGDGSIRFRDPGELTPVERQKIQSAGIRLAMGMIERGVTEFPDLATKLVAMLGDKIRPWLKSFYEGARWTPGYDKYEFTPSEEVAKFDVQNFDKPTYDAIKDAEMRVEERKAQAAAEQAEKELKETRNKQRKENDKQREADTAALADEGEAVAGEAESLAKTSEDAGELSRVSEKIDDALDKINNQLAILGYFERKGEDPLAMVERKAAEAGADLAARLVDELGLKLTDLPKGVNVASADFGKTGGYVNINLPLRSGYEPMRIEIRFDRTDNGSLRLTVVDTVMKRGGEESYISGEDHRAWFHAPKYGELVGLIKEQMEKHLPKEETPKDTNRFPDKADKEAVGKWLETNSETIWEGVDSMIEDAKQDKHLVATLTNKNNPDWMKADFVSDFMDQWSADHFEDFADTYVAAYEFGQKSAMAEIATERLLKALTQPEAASVNGYKVGDEVMWDRYGNGKWEKQTIVDFEPDGTPLFDSMGMGIMMEVGDWSRVKPADGIFGEAKRVAEEHRQKTLAEHGKNKVVADIVKAEIDKRGKSKDATPSEGIADATAKVVEILKSAKPRSKKKDIKPEQPVGDLFEGLFDDEPITDEKKTDIQPRTETTGRGGQQPRPNEPLGTRPKHKDEPTDRGGVAGRGTSNPAPDTNGGAGVSGLHKGESSVAKPQNTRNNHAERGVDYAPKGEKARIEANLAAIEVAKRLLAEDKTATPKDMEILRKYSGWGGLGAAFKEGESWNPNPANKRLRDLLTPEEYQAAVMSRNSAYYTPAPIIDAMWDIAKALGFKGGNIVEGSAGIGNIIGLMPGDLSERSNIHAVEIDDTTGGILSLLYPDAKVEIQGFEKTRIRNGSVDLAITNVPFVTGLHVMDESGDSDLSKKFRDIHDFCIAKNVRKLREGGIGIFISSSGTLDKSQALRNWLVNDKEGASDVVGVFRMHNQTFGGTAATSDIIVVRKRVNGRKSDNAIDVSTVVPLRVSAYTNEKNKTKDLPLLVNRYFIEHPEYMGGEMFFGFEQGDTYRPTSIGLFPTRSADQAGRMAKWVEGLSKLDWSREKSRTAPEHDVQDLIGEETPSGTKIGNLVMSKDGQICVAQFRGLKPLALNKNKIKGRTKENCLKDYQEIKDALKEVLQYQSEHNDDAGLQPLLGRLNRAYDTFVARYGNLNKNNNLAWLRNDVDFSSIVALESYSEKGQKDGSKVKTYGKTDIFSRRVVEMESEPKPQNVKDGIIASLYKFGRIDTEYLAEQLGKDKDAIKREIVESGLGFENPTTGQMEVSYEYLSGNVREKLRQAKELNETSGGKYDANVKALEAAVPMNIPAHLIEFALGSSWIEPKFYEKYVKERTGLDVHLTNASGTWYMDEPYYTSTDKNTEMGVRSEMFGTVTPGHKLIEAAITNKTISVSRSVKDSDGSTHTETDAAATTACATKVDEIRQDFKDWAREQMQADPDLSMKMETVYNEKFNNSVPVTIPDEFVPAHFGGAVTNMGGNPFSLRPHQAKSVIRATTQPLLLAHEVGTGKTFTLISTAMEMRRLGTARKPMIVVQNATVGQFVASAKALYPNAKVLTLEDADRNADGRMAFYAKIKYNDWDMIVVPQSVFERIPDSVERQTQFIQEKIEEEMRVLEKMQNADPRGRSHIVRAAEREIQNLQDEIAQLAGGGKSDKKKEKDAKKAAITRQNAEVKARELLERATDEVEDFDSMGIDAILVDEAHEYKHLGFATAMQRGVKGVDPSPSKKAQGVFLKAQSVLEKTGGKNVVFATGTPISNTAAEIWTFMRYLMPKEVMEAYEIYYFDDFVRNFGSLQQMLEFGTNGKYKEVNRFAGYFNLPELVRIWSTVADTVRTRDAGGVSDKIPQMEGDKAQDIFLPQTRALRSIMKYVKSELDAYDNMSGKEKKKNSHIPPVMYGIAKAAAVDARLVQSDAEDHPNSKTNEAVRQTLKSLGDTESYKGTVAIFADNYQNKKSGFNLYEDIRKKLIDAGVPQEQIVVMKSGMTVNKKLEIFNRVNSGEVRVILGSTFTLGTGVNIQERLHTLIHLDAPNRPMDYTQRNGRILRQGNLHNEWGIPVRVLRFGVEDSLDVTAYQRLKTKGAIADSIMNGQQLMLNSMESRSLEEEQDLFGDITAQLSGSEYALLKNQIEKEVRKLTAKYKDYKADQTYIHNRQRQIEGQNKAAEQRIAENKAYLEKVENATIGDITVGKTAYPSVEAMEEFFKEQNKKKKEMQEKVRESYSYGTTTSDLTVSIGGFDFKIHTEISRETDRKDGNLFASAPAKMTYSCPELGIESMPVKQNLIKNAVTEIMDEVLSGKDFRDRIEAAQNSIERNNAESESMAKRYGVPFKHTEELALAEKKLAEYEELMKAEMEAKEAKYAELDKSVEAATDVTLTEEDGEDNTPTNGDGNKYRLVEDGEELDWLESLGEDELVHVYRNVQILPDGTLASPMAAYNAETGEVRRLSPGRWNGPEERSIILTPEQEEKLAALNRDGHILNEKGKEVDYFKISKELRFIKPETEDAKLQFYLKRDGQDIWADYNPYDHAIKVMLNDQFKAAWKRPNLVVVEAVMPKSEMEGAYQAPYAALPTGEHKWNNGRSLYLSRWSRIVRIVPFAEVAADIDRYWRENPAAYKGAKVRDYDRFQPQVREELEKLGYTFDDKGKRGLLTEAEREEAYKSENAKYITSDDIERMNADMSLSWHETPATELALAPKPKTKAEAERLVMADRVEELSDKLNTPIRIITKESELQAVSEDGKPRYSRRERRAKGWWSSRTGEVVVVLPNNVNVADVEKTVVHEVVGHKGLRAFIGEERFDEFLGKVYDHASNPIRAKIDKETDRMVSEEADRLREQKRKAHERAGEDYNSTYYTDMAEARVEAEKKREECRREATEEYMADLGGRIGDEGFEKMSRDELTLWGKIKAKVQGFLDKFLKGLKIAKSIRLTDKDLAYILFKSWKNARERGVFADAEDAVRRKKSGYDADAQTRFRDPGLGLEEAITKMKTEAMNANTANLQAKRDAMRAIGGNLNHLRSAMARQREYDITTVKSVSDLARILMEKGLLDDLSKYETKRILSAINNVVGKQDVSRYVQKVMDIMVDNQLRLGANTLGRLMSIRGSRVDAQGIEVQGELDPEGQRIAQVVRKSTSLPKDDIDTRMAEAMNRMSSPDQTIADEATIEYAGLAIARQYVEDITESKAEEKALRESIKEAKEDKDAGQMTEDAYRQLAEATEEAIRQNKIERAESFYSLADQLGGVLSESIERAKQWRIAEKQRVEEIHHNANSDMTGRPTDEHHKDSKTQKIANNSALRFLLAPLATFDQMLRMFGGKSVRGEGYLWNRYMRGWVEAAEREYTNYQDALKTLDAKVSEVFDKKMTWGDLFSIDRKLPKASVKFWDGGEMKEHELTQGNLLYIYMADRMSDGRMKLRRMGITDTDVDNISNSLDPRFITLADWMQEEFLVDKRNEYNEVHKRMFGASMAAIENYFPLKILANARLENVDVADDTTDTALPATSTGSIIKRRRNNLALDVTGANAFSVILDHLQQMERWAAFAEFNRDLNTLLSYKRFRNQVMNMTSAYGAGKTLWNNFRNVCSMAAGAYRPPIAALDKAAVNVAKGVTAAKVSFRVFTALKQFLSIPAYASDSNPMHLAANIANPVGAWKWSMENLPLFEKRWKSRMAGDPRLLKSDMDWKMWRSRVVELASRVGMSPNAFVDALTVAIGSHAMYQTKKAKYLRRGMEEEAAEKRAKQDAAILFNQTQQSSEGAFLSTMQVDRSWLSVLFTVFRNSSMSYTRQLYDAMRNLSHRMTPGYKDMSHEYMAKQMRRDGIDPDTADREAKREYRRGIIRDLVRVGIFGAAMQMAWNLGAYLPYILLGDDKEEKDKMWSDVWTHTMFGSIEGLTGGDVMSAAGNMWAAGEGNPAYLTKDMPLAFDVLNILKKWDKDQVGAMNDVINLLVQSGLGVNPQSLTDATVAVMDFCGDDAQCARECALLITRILNCPQSQIDKIYFDQLNASGEEASRMTPQEIAERFARYKVRRGAPLTGWAYGSETRETLMNKYRDRSNKLAKERIDRASDPDQRQFFSDLMSEFQQVKMKLAQINNLKTNDEMQYRQLLDSFEDTPEFQRYLIVRDFKRDIDNLAKEWIQSESAHQQDSIIKEISQLKSDMIKEISQCQLQSQFP